MGKRHRTEGGQTLSTIWRLHEISDGGHADRELGSGAHVLGSGAAADLVFTNQTVSRRHAQLEITEAGVTIEDLGSTNGTKVDEEPVVDPVTITSRSILKLGSLVLSLTPSTTQPARFV